MVKRVSVAVSTVLAVLMLTALITPPVNAQPLERAGKCSDITVIGARGSGASQSGSRVDNFTGTSGPVYGVFKRLKKRFKKDKVSVSLQAVTYPAAQVQSLLTAPATFTSSINAGTSSMLAAARSLQRSCPDTKVVLAGFSQGAMVTHWAAGSAPSNVAAALLIADGFRNTSDKAVFVGTGSKTNRGVATGVLASPPPLTSTPPAVTVCLRGDVVCDASAELDLSSKVHTTGYLSKRVQNAQAKQLYKILK